MIINCSLNSFTELMDAAAPYLNVNGKSSFSKTARRMRSALRWWLEPTDENRPLSGAQPSGLRAGRQMANRFRSSLSVVVRRFSENFGSVFFGKSRSFAGSAPEMWTSVRRNADVVVILIITGIRFVSGKRLLISRLSQFVSFMTKFM